MESKANKEDPDGKPIRRFHGVVVVPVHSDIRSLKDLRGRSFAFGDENSTIGRYLVQGELVKAGIHESDLGPHAYLGRHDKVAKAVEVGDFDAGSIKIGTFKKLKGGNSASSIRLTT